MEVGVDAEAFGHALVAAGEAVWRVRGGGQCLARRREEVHVLGQLQPECGEPVTPASAVVPEQPDGLSIQRDAAHLVGLGVLLGAHTLT
jgi:hypothetical protein